MRRSAGAASRATAGAAPCCRSGRSFVARIIRSGRRGSRRARTLLPREIAGAAKEFDGRIATFDDCFGPDHSLAPAPWALISVHREQPSSSVYQPRFSIEYRTRRIDNQLGRYRNAETMELEPACQRPRLSMIAVALSRIVAPDPL